MSSLPTIETIRLGRQAGVRNTIDEIKAEAEKATAQEQLAEAKYRYLAAYLQLLHLAGKLGKEEGQKLEKQLFAQKKHQKQRKNSRFLPQEALRDGKKSLFLRFLYSKYWHNFVAKQEYGYFCIVQKTSLK